MRSARPRVINIAEHEHWCDYAEPANVVPVLSRRKKGSYDKYDHYVRVGLLVLCFCALAAVVFVRFTWNY